ncbi:MAG: prolipoprotein diacylglyceryl transferase, partial [Bacteriovoracaceae bacterium]|nr:prolipoprotein diacylglyceryl transferase [Bacteriovoracaceae bacterium]
MIDPVLLHLGPLQIRWYGLMYVVGFLVGGALLNKLARENFFRATKESIDQYILYLFIGMFLGARLAYVFIYNWTYYSEHLSEILSVWQGGLSFHGALFGMVVGTALFAKKQKMPFAEIADAAVIAGTPGLFFGRMGNFINGELYGRVTTVPWGMVFPEGGPLPRHPSQLYEGLLEGLILFLLLFFLRKKVSYRGLIFSFFILGYAIFRFIVEFFREADEQVGYFFSEYIT